MKVDVCGQKFEIVDVDNNSRTDMSMGRSDSKLGIITLNKGMPKDIRNVTLIHEWLHAVLDNYGFNEEINNELVVNAISIELNRHGFKLKEK